MKTNTVTPYFANIMRYAAPMLALGSLLALSHQSARADVVVDTWVGPSQALNVPAGSTIMQVKVRNTDPTTVSGLTLSTNLIAYYYALGPLEFYWDFTSPSSGAFTIGPYEQRWINVPIPANGRNGRALYGHNIRGTVTLTGKPAFSVSFKDVAPVANVQFGNITAPANDNAGTPFYVTVTNKGTATSTAQTISGSLYANGDGRVSPYYPLSAQVPALTAGASHTVTFLMPQIATYGNTGYSNIMGTLTLGSQTVSVSF